MLKLGEIAFPWEEFINWLYNNKLSELKTYILVVYKINRFYSEMLIYVCMYECMYIMEGYIVGTIYKNGKGELIYIH